MGDTLGLALAGMMVAGFIGWLLLLARSLHLGRQYFECMKQTDKKEWDRLNRGMVWGNSGGWPFIISALTHKPEEIEDARLTEIRNRARKAHLLVLYYFAFTGFLIMLGGIMAQSQSGLPGS